MAGQRVTHATSTGAQQTVHLAGFWPYVEIVNWGTVTLMASALTGGGGTPTLTWMGDDTDVIPVGSSVVIPVGGPGFDQGGGVGSNPGIDVFVLSQTAGSTFTVNGSNG